MTEHRVLLVIDDEGSVSGPLLSAASVVIADVSEMDIVRWEMHHVGWNMLRGAGDAEWRVAAFIRDHRVQAIVVDQVPASTREALAALGIAVFERAGISARAAAVSAAAVLARVHRGS